MKLIDERGRLFGKVNIIDLFVLIVIILVIGVACYRLGESESESKGKVKSVSVETVQKIDVTFTVRCTVRKESLAKSMHPLEFLISKNTVTDAYIESIRYTDAMIPTTDSDGRPIYSNDPFKKDVFVTIKMKADPRSPLVKLGVQEVLINNNFTVKTKTACFAGTIEDMQIHP